MTEQPCFRTTKLRVMNRAKMSSYKLRYFQRPQDNENTWLHNVCIGDIITSSSLTNSTTWTSFQQSLLYWSHPVTSVNMTTEGFVLMNGPLRTNDTN